MYPGLRESCTADDNWVKYCVLLRFLRLPSSDSALANYKSGECVAKGKEIDRILGLGYATQREEPGVIEKAQTR